jgi:uncharacterized damage-inducible protein DinB
VDIPALLLEIYGRIPPLAEGAVDGLSAEQLTAAPSPGANTIGWLIWHLTRVQDHHVAELVGEDQVWTTGEWASRCGLEPDPTNTGYGHGPDEVRCVQPEAPDALLDYLNVVQERTARVLAGITSEDLDRVVDTRWDPPVTMGVRLVSIADDCIQHAGQAAYVRGLLNY